MFVKSVREDRSKACQGKEMCVKGTMEHSQETRPVIANILIQVHFQGRLPEQHH